ncbi:hypothetical protein H6F90_21380 [Trichocoleus sp. FACHB-591]|uniref:hypothetical protein n=1 Tax=Trichocoleus sp. FACHB-591 TaxID=2692872 RepID=UPI0016891F6D|nr:hypothetical protein [Trichocoleus sp. FACHB-591]MBD2097654.1 hypothetical protein [Trichocoleus sp. FACHB-591]
MERGLLWLPLLGVFIWLAWAGWNEYQKVEAYRRWAEQFERAKYDIYAVLGQQGSDLTWGQPTRRGPINLAAFSLKEVQAIRLLVDDQAVDLNALPQKGRSIFLEFSLPNPAQPIRIPFTDVTLAANWGRHLQQELGSYS